MNGVPGGGMGRRPLGSQRTLVLMGILIVEEKKLDFASFRNFSQVDTLVKVAGVQHGAWAELT